MLDDETKTEGDHKTEIVRCIICGSEYEYANMSCPVCHYPVLSISSDPDRIELAADDIYSNGKPGTVDLSKIVLVRPYTRTEIDELGKTVSRETLEKLSADYRKSFYYDGNIYAQINLGLLYYKGYGVKKDLDTAGELLKKPAETGEAQAQYYYGLTLLILKIPGKEKEAIEWICRSAGQGNSDAQYNLGSLYEKGRVVERDYSKAAEWYLKAAEQGHVDAQYNLGYLYKDGRGVKQDYSKAAEWYLKAAEQGHAGAQRNLSLLYQYGQGVERDYIKAAEWLHKVDFS